MLLVARGTPSEERVRYQRIHAASDRFQLLSRGRQCTAPADHPAGTGFLWSGLAEPLELQDPPPPPGLFDGVALEPNGPLYFRGDGAGFCCRVPVEPKGETRDGEGERGAELLDPGGTDGWTVYYFAPDFELFEGDTRDDINGDGDLADRFEVGQLRRRTWSAVGGTVRPLDVGLGPRSILQERCNRGGDLDSDGFDDPLFLWDERGRWLHVRLFVLGHSASNAAVVRRVESTLLLRSEPED
jgi:hypothetical protein